MTALLTTLVAFGALSNNMYLPSFPSLARTFGVPVSGVLLTLAAFFIGFAVGQLFYGSVSDRFGRRPVLLTGIAAYTVASAVCGAAPDIATLIAARAVQGLAAASTQVLSRAIVRDIYPPHRAARMLSIMAAVFTLAPGLRAGAGRVPAVVVRLARDLRHPDHDRPRGRPHRVAGPRRDAARPRRPGASIRGA